MATTAEGLLSDADFDRFREFFYRRTGIQFAANKRSFVDKRAADCISASGDADFVTWFAHLRLGEAGLVQQMVNRFTVNETYFLREEYQFDSLVLSVLPQILAERHGAGPVRILSIPCSTGEEPYSIAIELLERWPQIAEVDVQIIAADIDTGALDAARSGFFGARSLQRMTQWLVDRYFSPVDDGRYRINADLREAVDFRVANICDTSSMRSFRLCDVIYCRNLLIYFDELSSRQAAENLFGALSPGGFLFLGHSESMSRISPIFTPVHFPEGIVYQRPKASTR
jgi:chemotaxis protein methyltransferase CheR